ncbi:Crp/Fnr family transcriptional regulator [Sphingomonas panaciterrae]|uniref:Crp/Fnr family transcriptional regulator n=1 Tax=Sphingomonas panaciterrae TaxID=1462999 RepID=UPI002FF4330C
MTNPLLAKLGAVASLSADDHRAIEIICTGTRMIGDHKDIVREGEKPEHIYIMLDGWAARYKTLPDGGRQITAFLLPGDICDMGAAVLKQADHSVIALTQVTVASVTRASLIEVTRERPSLAQAFWWAGLVDEAVLRTWIVNLGRRDAHARIAHLLCELHARIKRVGQVQDGEFSLPLTQEQLADALGLTSVHVNRTLQRLRTEGLVALRNRRLTILDTERLGEAAGFDSGYLHASAA